MFHSLDFEPLLRSVIFVLCMILVGMLTELNRKEEIATHGTFFVYQYTNGRMRRLI